MYMSECQYDVLVTNIPDDTHIIELKAIYGKLWNQIRLCCKDLLGLETI
jgi:hypothetical protein